MSKTGKPDAPVRKRTTTATGARRAAQAGSTPKRPRAARSVLADAPLPKAPDAMPEAPADARPRAVEPASRVQWVRQSCRLTTAEYAELSALKKRAAVLARPTKRGRLLRAGLYALRGMSDAQLFALLDSVPEPQDATA